MKQGERGFTLIELLVVIAIIGILSAVVLASLNTARQKSRDAKRIADLRQIQLALEFSFDTNRTYPVGDEAVYAGLVTAGFIPIAPIPPGGTTAVVYDYQSANNVIPATSCAATTCTSYILRAQLEDVAHVILTGGNDIDGAAQAGLDCQDASGYYCVRP